MKRLVLAAFALGAAVLVGPTAKPAMAAPAQMTGTIAEAQPLVAKAHSRRWYFVRRHFRPYGYYRRPYWRRPVYYRAYGYYRRPYWHRRIYYRPAFYGRPHWHRRHYWHRPWGFRRWHHRHWRRW